MAMATMEATAGRKEFYSDYMLFNPKKASLFDLIALLFSRNIKNRKFIETTIETEDSFMYRVAVFLTTLLQKFLLTISIPMALAGQTFEDMCNLFTNNGGLFGLVKRVMTGKVVIPDREAATYVSAVGYTDLRMDLSKEILYGNSMYYPSLSIMAAKAVYNNAAYNKSIIEDHWGMQLIGFKNYWNDFMMKADTQVSLFRNKTAEHDTIIVCFRGTQPFSADDWCSDADLSWYEFNGIGRIHSGFLKALGMQKIVGWPKFVIPDITRRAPLAYYDIRDTLRDLLKKNPDAKFIVTGHSLGGALAALFPAILFYHDDQLLLERMEGVYTFGQPRVGDEAFASYMEKNLNKNGIGFYRYVYCNDMVPRVPFNGMFKHFGTCVYYNNKYQAKIVEDVPYKNYFSIFGFIPMHSNAIYEVIRSFSMKIKYGSDYRDGWLMFGVRLFGMLIPGIANHCPQDYVNSTRLGKPDDVLFLPLHTKKSLGFEVPLLAA
ncbi:Alpha/beta-Hydrolases superfamily protein, putative isoform 2 [Hibiscus syriacus]|uniref:Alpha/beta-Hydrolases superfamily protein, putative isoform 2 n=1 Tax=Hibiscus syriacus TaxID=106335 RepID=A0A6A2ZSB4_HIBSY|nr:triacylglycerol lipase OBL1-like [Hibiscus syriacus]KAE8694042.1 Alpha/beta-Hydrolases superfamily protein, putative isoform 2 [Hibiscus syriacus]